VSRQVAFQLLETVPVSVFRMIILGLPLGNETFFEVSPLRRYYT
jgi:hypothetical protein